MEIQLNGSILSLQHMKPEEYEIQSWGLTRWDKKSKALRGYANLELLDKLSALTTLPVLIEARRQQLQAVQDAVDRERLTEHPRPLVRYPVKTPLYAHQIRGANMCLLTFGMTAPAPEESGKGFGLLFEMGTGKTLTAIAIIGAGYKLGRLRRILIVAPTSVCNVWPKELAQHANYPYIVRTLLGTKVQRLKALHDMIQCPYCDLKIAVLNYESVWRDGIFKALADYDADLIICDESQRIKTHNTAQSKAMHRLGDHARYKLILSGTPIQNEAVDIWSQYRFLDPTVFGDNFYTFRSRYCVMGGYGQKQIVAYKKLDDLICKEYSIAYRVTKAEALDLPEQTFDNRCILLDKQERNLYNRLCRDSYAELENGETITATTVLTKLLRLQQFTGGFLAIDNAKKPQIGIRGKLDALSDILRDYVVEGKKKLVVFARFRAEIQGIEALCQKVLGEAGMQAVSLHGDIPKEERGNIVQQFQTDPATMVIVGQIDTMGAGLTLTAADTCVYYSTTWNYATYDQSLSRIHRIGQRNTCHYIHLIAQNTIDEHILEVLAKKEDMAKTVVDSWRTYFT